MIVSVVIVCYTSGGVIFSRFYGHELRTEQQQAKWLKKLRDATAPDWALLKEDNPEQIATVGEVQITYKLLGDVVLMVAGVEEHDALLLLELVRSLDLSIRGACKIPENKQQQTTVSAERRILQNHANLCLVIDEQIDDGDIDHLDSKVVLKLIRMRPGR
ncbi:hypothetical protein BWQ96_03621 [Gracilariopsis chorda]|uniref:Coatomer subunit zeta n=1 Tax=Gracilariopsis chorda TaxID=448386 RepID=A0A2V3IWW7_9FLOR|nr:hypothetical protein BWQ96_03621 [Gracilariopsis chorda]|eukprot:PXF46632.1 hypothetical protein BWQ96_03621 [Gracilariopsis chorda]